MTDELPLDHEPYAPHLNQHTHAEIPIGAPGFEMAIASGGVFFHCALTNNEVMRLNIVAR